MLYLDFVFDTSAVDLRFNVSEGYEMSRGLLVVK